MIVAGAFLFKRLLDFRICFIKPVLVFPAREADNFSCGFLWFGLHLLSLFFTLYSLHTMKSFLQHDLEIVSHPWVTKFVLLQFLVWGLSSWEESCR